MTEGTAAQFTVTASDAPSADLTVNLTVSESAGSDYVAASNEGSKTVTITASSTTATYSVATENDTANEPNGTVTVAVAAGTGYSVGTASSADVTVNDNDRAAISGVEITSSPAFGDTYRRRENVEVTVTWDEDVTWDLSAANARMRVRLNIGGTNRAADLVTGGETSGTARSLAFRYAVVNSDSDGNGLAVVTNSSGEPVILVGGATLQGADGRAARRVHAGLAADANHKVDGSVVTRAPTAPSAPNVSSASSTSLLVSWSAPTNLGTATSITDYDLRYFQGTTAPSNNAEWIREGEANGPPDPGSSTSATITGLTTGAPYLVQVRAFGDLESPWSTSTSGTPQPEAPSAPSTPTVSAASKTSLSVSWSAPSDLGSASSITDYDLRYFAGTADPMNEANWIEEGETNGPPDPGSSTSAKITGLTEGTVYRVQVRAFGDVESPWSASASGTPENQAPVFTATDSSDVDESINAIGGTLVSLKADRAQFSDPDGDALTFTVSLSREDTHSSFTDFSGDPDSGRIFFLSKGSCELANLDPPLSAPPVPETTVTLTAEDPSGETAQITRNYLLTSFANADGSIICPSLTGAAVTAGTLTLTYEGGSGWTPSNLQASEFTVKADGTAVDLADMDAVTIGTPVTTGTRTTTPVTLKLAAPVGHGQGVTVSHAPGSSPSTVGFADVTATNNTPEADTTPPALDSAAVTDGRTLTLTFGESLATLGGQELKELRWAFSADGLYNDGVRLRNVVPSQVAVSGPTVTVTFGGLEALPGRDVSVSYRASIAEELGTSLQDGSGNKVAAFTRTLTRATSVPIPPVLSAAQVAGTALTMTFDRALDAGSAPSGSRFRVTHRAGDWHGETVFVSGTGTASVSGSTVTVTLAEAVPQDSFVQVAYSKGDDANPLRGASSGPEVADIWWSSVVTVIDKTPPKLVSGSVAGTRVTLYYGEALDTGSTPATGDFTVTAAGTAQTVSSVAMSASAVKLTLGASVASGSAVLVTYTAGTNPVRDLAGNDAANLSGETVTNRGNSDPGKPALAAAEPPSMAGALLTLTFDRDLDPASVPAASAFTISDSDDSDEWGRSVTGVEVRGRKVELVVSPGWYPCSEPLTVTYGKPAANALSNVWGTEADGFSGQAVTNARASECIYNWMAQARMGSVILTARRPFAQDAEPRTAWFSVVASGGPVTVTEAAYDPDNRHELKLTLSRDIAPDETATVSYRRPRGEAGLWDADGRQLADIGPAPVAGKAPAVPTVTGASVVSDAGHDGTYALGETIRVQVTFSEAVSVDSEGGTPRLTIKMDPGWGEFRASYAGGDGTEALTFTHTVVEPNTSPRGIAVLANTLELNDGTIRSEASGADANLAHAGLGHDAAHKVNWRLAPSDVTGVAVVSDAGDDDTYALGETIRIRVTFGEPVSVDTEGGTPRLKIKMDPGWGTFPAAYEGGDGTKALTFTHTVVEPNTSPRGIAVLANTLQTNGGAIRLAATSVDARLPHTGLGHEPAHKVNWRLSPAPADAPAVTAVAVVSDPGEDATYAAGDTVRVAVTFSEAVDVDAEGGTPRLKLDLGGDDGAGERWATWEDGTGTDTLAFAWTAAAPDEAADGIAVLADTLETGGGTIRSAATQTDAALGHAGIAADPAHKADAAAPQVLRGEIDGGTMTLFLSEALDPDATGGEFHMAVETPERGVVGFRALGGVTVNGETVTVGMGAGYPRATAGLKRNWVRYVRRADGGGGALRDLAGNPVTAPHRMGSTNGAVSRYIRIDLENVTRSVPQVTAVAVVSDAGGDDTYALGDTIEIRMTFSEAVNVDTAGGTPRLTIKMDPTWGEFRASYAGGDGTNALTFTHTVAEPNTSPRGIAVLANTLELNDGTIRSEASGADANLAHAGLGHDPGHKVNWRIQPSDVTAVAVVSDAGDDDTYALGDTIRVRVTFAEAVSVDTAGGTPRLMIRMDPGWGTFPAAWEGGDGTHALIFTHTVVEPNTSPQGIAVLANTLQANGGAIRLAATNADARLAHTGLGHDPAHKVNWRVSPTGAPTVTGVAVVSDAGDDDTYALGETIRVQVTFSEAVTVDGTGGAPRLMIRMDPGWGTFPAAWEGGSGTSRLTFTHTVVQPNTSPRGIAVLANSLATGGGTIRSAATGVDAGLAHAELGHDPKHKVDWRPALTVADAVARERIDATIDFEVTLGGDASAGAVVEYATADGTAVAWEDYQPVGGTLIFLPDERRKVVKVRIFDDALHEGRETLTFRLFNARGARIVDGEATGTIVNSDPLQKMWLSRFGRTVADHVTGAVSDRLSGPLTGAQVTVGGQTVDLAETQDDAFLGRALTSIAQVMGAPSGPAPANGEGWPRSPGSGPDHAGADGWPGTGLGVAEAPTPASASARSVTGGELLLGSAFHLAMDGDGAGPRLAAWGRVTAGRFDGESLADAGDVRIDGDVMTGILGTDAEWGRVLAGVALSLSEGEGTFDQPGVDSGTVESTMTMVSPYARVTLGERLSAWGLAGAGTGDMTIVQAANAATGQPERLTRTDLAMRLAALGGRGALLQGGRFDLALRADVFFVETEADAVAGEGATTADASRVRLVLEGSRAFVVGDGVITPGLEIGLRHDGGDAETGTGVEVGGRVSWTDPGTGLSLEANVRALVAHEDSGYEEWGASGALRLAPGERGRGLSFSLAPTYGAPSSGVERLWSARDARGLGAAGGTFEPESRLAGELGYGFALPGGFMGTPNVGFALANGVRDYRVGWRLAPAGAAGFEVNLDATRREPANLDGADAAPVEHEVLLRGALRW